MAAVELRSLPPEEAIAYLKAKGYKLSPSYDWRDIWQQEHAAQFTVAKSAGFDILGDIHAALVQALTKGTTLEDFKRQLQPILQDKGWWGRGMAPDPATGKSAPAQLGSPRRLQTIFNVNMRMAYAAGKWAQAQRTRDTHPYVEYSAILDDHTREDHRKWNGTVVPLDHPWLDTHTPPCGWGCRCTLRQLSRQQVQDEGLTIANPQPGKSVTYTNARTGEVAEVPEGIDPGFGYNPGRVAVDLHAARVAAAKWVSAPPPLAAAAQAESVRFMLGALTKDFGEWVGKIAETGHTIGDRRVVGALSQDVLDFLDTKGASPMSGAITVQDNAIAHFRSDRHARGTFKPDGTPRRPAVAPPLTDLMRLPELTANPERVLWDKKQQSLLYVFSPSDGDTRLGKFVLEVNWSSKGKGPLYTNAIVHNSLVQEVDLANSGAYEEVPMGKS